MRWHMSVGLAGDSPTAKMVHSGSGQCYESNLHSAQEAEVLHQHCVRRLTLQHCAGGGGDAPRPPCSPGQQAPHDKGEVGGILLRAVARSLQDAPEW